MAKEDLGLRLTAEITQWVTNLAKAERSADGLRLTVVALEKAVRTAFASIDSIARQGGLGIGQSFLKAATDVDTATGRMETDTAKASKSFQNLALSAENSAKIVGGSTTAISGSAANVAKATAQAGAASVAAVGGIEGAFKNLGASVKGQVLNIQNAIVGLGALTIGKQVISSASEFGSAIAYVSTVLEDGGVPLAQ